MSNDIDFKVQIDALKDELIADIGSLVKIKSVRDMSSTAKGSPFGTGIRLAFDEFRRIAEDKGFSCRDFEGYAIDAQIGDGDEYVAVLGHLDTVEEIERGKWDTDPFRLVEKDGILYGRGVNDDKGPLLAGLYAAYILRKMGIPLKRSIRIIAGGAEETTWECMDHYFNKNSQPAFGFSPDGNFPIVNGEKGILNVRIDFSNEKEILTGSFPITRITSPTSGGFVCNQLEVEMSGEDWFGADRRKHEVHAPTKVNSSRVITYREGKVLWNYTEKKTLSRNPEKGENAIFDFLDDFNFQKLVLRPKDLTEKNKGNDENMKNPPGFCRVFEYIERYLYRDPYGKKLGLYSEDREMGRPSVCPSALVYEGRKAQLYLEIRYTKSITADEVLEKLETSLAPYMANLSVLKSRDLLYVPEDSGLVICLKAAYEKVMGEKAEVFTKGGASYARVLQTGVAFGPTFDGETANSHMENERISIASLLKATEIYCEALYLLAGK